jgi:hypothetical protein
MSSADISVAIKNLAVGQKLELANGDEVQTFEIISRNEEVCNPPEYQFKNVETGVEHGPVFWQWLDREDIKFLMPSDKEDVEFIKPE